MAESNPGPAFGQQIFGGPTGMFGGSGNVQLPVLIGFTNKTLFVYAGNKVASAYAVKV